MSIREVVDGSLSAVVLLHGGWGGAWCWAPVASALAAAGHPVVAPDLPGGGLTAVGPRSFHAQDVEGMRGERSALAEVSLEQCAAPAAALLQTMYERYGPVVVVGHSINGVLLHCLGEQMPETISRLVYLAAVGPGPGRSVAMDTAEPAWSSSLFSALLVADPATVGALRINPASTDEDYRQAVMRCWFDDVPAATAAVAMRMLASDNPGALLSAPSVLTAQRWGSIPRTWVRTTRDASIPVTGQDTNIAELDAAFPEHRFEIRSVDSGHMPFLSVPGELVTILHETASTPDIDSASRLTNPTARNPLRHPDSPYR